MPSPPTIGSSTIRSRSARTVQPASGARRRWRNARPAPLVSFRPLPVAPPCAPTAPPGSSGKIARAPAPHVLTPSSALQPLRQRVSGAPLASGKLHLARPCATTAPRASFPRKLPKTTGAMTAPRASGRAPLWWHLIARHAPPARLAQQPRRAARPAKLGSLRRSAVRAWPAMVSLYPQGRPVAVLQEALLATWCRRRAPAPRPSRASSNVCLPPPSSPEV